MGDALPTIRVAAVQAAPVFLDREASVEKAASLILEAGAHGATLIGFPEGFIPGHPLWYHFRPATDQGSIRLAMRLFDNAVVVPSRATDALCEAAARARAYVVMGICEKLPDTTGTMFNSQLFIDPEGRIIGKHQKLVPTVGERLVHTGGFGDSIGAVPTAFGKIGGLICGESSNPLLVFSLLAEYSLVQVISWPSRFQKEGVTCAERAELAGRAVASMSKAFVVNAIGTMTDEMREALAYTEEDRQILADPSVGGGSSIIDPFGRIVAGPLGPEEGILYADVDLEECVRARLEHDLAGHYNRPDVFQVVLRTERPRLYTRLAPGEGGAAGAQGTRVDLLGEAAERLAGALGDA
jgi:nitrilase